MTKNNGAIKLLDTWLADESGYDERTWPVIEEILKGEEMRLFIWHYAGNERYDNVIDCMVMAEIREGARFLFMEWCEDTFPALARDTEWNVDEYRIGDMGVLHGSGAFVLLG